MAESQLIISILIQRHLPNPLPFLANIGSITVIFLNKLISKPNPLVLKLQTRPNLAALITQQPSIIRTNKNTMSNQINIVDRTGNLFGMEPLRCDVEAVDFLACDHTVDID